MSQPPDPTKPAVTRAVKPGAKRKPAAQQVTSRARVAAKGKRLPAAPAAAVSKRASNKESNRAAILAAAKACFLNQGYDAVTIRDVVRQSGLAAGTFYNYFQDKDVLFRAVLEQRIAEVSGAMRAARLKADTVEGFVYSALFALFSMAEHDPSFFHLIQRNEYAVRTLFDDSVMGVPMRELVADIEDFTARGIFPPMDVHMLSAAFFGVGYEISRYIALKPKVKAAEAAQFATQLMTGGIAALGLLRPEANRGSKGSMRLSGTLP